MEEIPKWLESLQRLDPKKAAKRIAGWKDTTLAKRLQKIGIEKYAESTIKKMKRGTFEISDNVKEQLTKKVIKTAKQIPKEAAGTTVIGGAAGGGKWFTVEEWMQRYGRGNRFFNIPYSIGMVRNRGFSFVYEWGAQRIFTNRKVEGIPTGQPNTAQHLVYEIAYEGATDAEEWIQASLSFKYYGVPLSSEALQEMNHDIEQMDERNRGKQRTFKPNEHAYTWWKHGATRAGYNLIGIGVKL